MFLVLVRCVMFVYFFKHKTAYELRISDWSSDVCSSDLEALSAIEATAGLVPTSGGKSVATALYFAVGNEAAGQYLAQARRDLDGEYLHMLAIMLLLQARNATGFREEDRSRLNRSEEHTSELQSLMRISYAVFCLKKQK